MLHLQLPQPTSSHASTLANAVRIEKLSDEEDEEVDITDGLSDDDGDSGDKPQAALKHEFREPERPTDTEIQTDTPAGDQKQAGLTETEDQTSHTALSLQSPQSLSSCPCSGKTGVTGLDEKGDERVSLHPKSLQAGAQKDSDQMTDENEDQSSQSESSAQTGQLEEAGSDDTGKAHACCFYVKPPHNFFSLVKSRCGLMCLADNADKDEQGVTDRPEDNQEEEENEDEEELKAPEQEMEMDMETIAEDEKQAIPEFFEGRPSKTPGRYLKIRNYILDQW